ncbi:hypothetical protein TNCV_3888171 [Trichonephila clavipes]|nr:hypothetical protein TNCV_3888171 [Trichonephila clavipes]
MMERRLHIPGNVDDPAQQLEQIWQEIPQENLRSLYHSMPRHVAACIQAKATRGLLATDHVILNHGQVTWTTPELAPPSPNYHTTPTGGRFSSRQI